MFSRILIANRGEIALRILRACKELNVETVVVYSQADRNAAFLRLADHTICIGNSAPMDSYLNSPRIVSAAEVTNVDAIHPGYGFLAENAHFADICRSCKIEFIGPTVEAMQLLGDKVAARHLAEKVHVATVPGSDSPIENEDEAVELARKVSYPVILKAAGGGGGREGCVSPTTRPTCDPVSIRLGEKRRWRSKTAGFTSKNLSSTHGM